MSQSLFCSKRWKGGKNRRRICPINDDLTSAYTWDTPPKQSLCQEGLSS